MRSSHYQAESLSNFSIIIAQAKCDPEIKDAILADDAFREIWPLVIDVDNLTKRANSQDLLHNQPIASEPKESSQMRESANSGVGGWSFFGSPQFYVVSATIVVLLAGAGMYAKLDGKIDSLRLEVKADLQEATRESGARFDKVDAKFDRVDARFDALLQKMDEEARETRLLIRGMDKSAT